jgi:hypothetical protein
LALMPLRPPAEWLAIIGMVAVILAIALLFWR